MPFGDVEKEFLKRSLRVFFCACDHMGISRGSRVYGIELLDGYFEIKALFLFKELLPNALFRFEEHLAARTSQYFI